MMVLCRIIWELSDGFAIQLEDCVRNTQKRLQQPIPPKE